MNHNPDRYKLVPFPVMREGMIDFLRMGQHKHIIHALTEMDVTLARQYMRDYKEQTGQSLSFTAYVIACLAQAIAQDKTFHAYRKGRKQLILFEEVDVTTLIERELDGKKMPLFPYIVRGANSKAVEQISEEIRRAQATEAEKNREAEKRLAKRMKLALVLPKWVRDLLYAIILKNPLHRKRMEGTVAVTAIGMFGKGVGWGIPIISHTLVLTLGGISLKPGVIEGRIEIREYLNMTISVDHDIIDGAPLARFNERLKGLIETAQLLSLPEKYDGVGKELKIGL